MSMIEDIRKDRERRILPGPWRVLDGKRSLQIHGERHWVANIKCESCPAYEESTARRIARVPDMEAALLAAEELAKFVDLVDGSFGGGRVVTFSDADIADCRQALAAYRAATGGAA